MVAHWSHDYFLIESDAAAGTNIETVEAINASLTKIDSYVDEAPKEIISGLWKNAGGSGTR